jgi:hypothetical protein
LALLTAAQSRLEAKTKCSAQSLQDIALADKRNHDAAYCAGEHFAREYDEHCAGQVRDCRAVARSAVDYYTICWQTEGDNKLYCAYRAGYFQAVYQVVAKDYGSTPRRRSGGRTTGSGAGNRFGVGPTIAPCAAPNAAQGPC